MKTISIGIPAFNEEANIGFLLKDIFAQNKKTFRLEKIIVCSDGSTDLTVEKIRKIKNKKILLIDNKKRLGRAVRQNQIMQKSNSDILILLDADIQIKDKNFLQKIIKPVISQAADLTSVSVKEFAPENFLEKVLETSMKFKKFIYENYQNGNNLYTCHGRARAFSKKLYKKINFKESTGEDAYSYFYAKTQGFKYVLVRNTQIYYKLPGSFMDHEKQSIRFYKTQKLMEKEFGKNVLQKEDFMSPFLLIKNLVKYFFIDSVILFYFFIATFLKVKSLLSGNINNTWSVSQSSKNLRKGLK